MWRRRGGLGGVALACLTLSITWKFGQEATEGITGRNKQFWDQTCLWLDAVANHQQYQSNRSRSPWRPGRTFNVLCLLHQARSCHTTYHSQQHGGCPPAWRGQRHAGVRFILKHVWMYLFVDGGTEPSQQETVGDNRKSTQDGGEDDRQPNDGLAQGISSGTWKRTNAIAKWDTDCDYGVEILKCTTIFSVEPYWCLTAHL